MRILVDVSGADRGIETSIAAAVNVVQKVEKIVLVGIKEDIVQAFRNIKKTDMIDKFEILECKEYITNNEEPAFAIKNKKESNLVIAFNYMRENSDVALISASSTGALMAGSLLKIGRIKGIHRPALMTLLPTIEGQDVIFLDSGANPEAKDVSIVQYAKLGEIYAKHILRINNPTIGLLNIGAEEEKGTPTLKETYRMLKETYPNFTGNIEARYILSGKVDVIVCDGLMGNVALKSLEGTASIIKKVITSEFKKGPLSLIAGLFAKPVLSSALKKFDYKEHDGAVFLGVKKPVIKIHGSSNVTSYEKAILQAKKILETNIIEKISNEMGK